MLINPIYIRNYNISKQNNASVGKTNKNTTIPQQQKSFLDKSEKLSKLQLHNLSSRFNINFCSNIESKAEEFDLDEFPRDFEKQILTFFESCPKEKFLINSSSDIDYINQVFAQDLIGEVYDSGISLNNAFRYLASKEQIELNQTYDSKTAFVLDTLSIEYLRELKKESPKDFNNFLKRVKARDIIFYSFNADKNETKNLVNNFREVVDCNCCMRVFRNNKNIKNNYPNADKIKKILIEFARYKCPDDKLVQEKLIELCAKYLKDSFYILTYQTIAQQAKELFALIENEVLSQGKAMEDIIYIVPLSNKSYDLINCIYALENNIGHDKFITIAQLKKKMQNNEQGDYKNKVYVVLDDLSISGLSAEETVDSLYNHDVLENKKNNLIFCSIASSSAARIFMESVIKENKEKKGVDIKFLSPLEYCSMGDIKILDREGQLQYHDKFSNLSKEEIEFLKNNLTAGYTSQYSCIFMPYMIPDNSSDLAGILGSYFLNNDTKAANKVIRAKYESEKSKISESNYKQIKSLINTYHTKNY